MGELLEKGKNLRRFILELAWIVCGTILLLPLSLALAKWLFK